MGFKVASRVRGLSDEAFREAFGTEEQCRTALVRLRWPDGFVCPCCGHREHCVLAGRGLYQCNRCKKQTSPTAGTIAVIVDERDHGLNRRSSSAWAK